LFGVVEITGTLKTSSQKYLEQSRVLNDYFLELREQERGKLVILNVNGGQTDLL
jgi:hypothetical protein